MSRTPRIETIGLMGFGAFGRYLARHLAAHARISAYDPRGVDSSYAAAGAVREVARCDLVVLAAPVAQIGDVCAEIRPWLRPGAVVADVGSVKVAPANAMAAGLPDHVDIVGLHPLFGPESAPDLISGRKIAVCNVRGRSHLRLAALLKRLLGLEVFVVTPEAHDREAAIVQGLTHMIASILTGMQPLPTRMTTVSYDKLIDATNLVKNDAPGVFDAIMRDNPFAAATRDEFIDKALGLKDRFG